MVGEDQRRVVVEGRLGIDDRRQRVDLGPHRAGRVLALLVGLGEHDGDRLADEANSVDGERRPGEVVVDLHESVVGRDAELGGGPHRDDARHPDRVLDVDRPDRAVGDARTDEDGLHGAFELKVGDVPPLSGEQSRVLGSQHPSTEHRTVNRTVAQVAVRVAGRVVNGLVGGTSHTANVPRAMP